MITTLYDTFNCWSENGSLFIYSDPHFADEETKHIRINNISDEEQVERINKVVHKNDTLIILGDIGDISYIPKLKAGYKVLIKGNHDRGKNCYKKEYLNLVFNADDYGGLSNLPILGEPYDDTSEKRLRKELMQKYPNTDITIIPSLFDYRNPFDSFNVLIDNRMFDEVYEGPLFISDKILLSHEPIDLPFVFNIHGHDHSNWYNIEGKHMNCCAEHINYTPVNLKDIINSGVLKDIPSVHRVAINKQIDRKNKEEIKQRRDFIESHEVHIGRDENGEMKADILPVDKDIK